MFTRRSSARSRAPLGFTLVEMMFTVVIGGIITAAIGSFSLFMAKGFAATANYVDLDDASRKALDTLTRDIRQSDAVTSASTNQLTLRDASGASIQYVYSPSGGTLVRVASGRSTTLLRDCESFSFQLFQRNPVAGSYDQHPTAAAGTCKLVSMNWVCARKLLGQIRNSESVQTAKVVIRRQ